MRGVKEILAHHAGARLALHRTGRYPSPEELARLVDSGGFPELRLFACRGNRDVAAAVLADKAGLARDLGQLCQSLRRKGEKKSLGQVFTPAPAVESALNLVQGSPQRIVDPACGAGDFLLHAARRWPGALLTGVEIDALACAVAGVRLRLAGVEAELRHDNALSGAWAADFDLVVGNPPWGRTPATAEAPRSTAFPAPANAFVYFLELAARLLRPGGQMVYILPEALCKVWAYRQVRQWLLAHFAITALHYIPNLFKDYYAPALILAARRCPAPAPAAIPVWYQAGLRRAKTRYNTLPPAALTPERFNLNWAEEMERIWAQCSRGAVFLREGNWGAQTPPGEAVVDFSLGIVTGDNRRFLARERFTPRHLPLLRARDVQPFRIAPPGWWLEYDASSLQQAAPLEKYRVPAKIVYRFVAREIIAAVDYSGSLTLNDLNILLPLRLPFSLEYLAALFNSRLLNTLYMYRFSTGKVLTRHLKQLPLQVGSREMQREIEACFRARGRGLDQAVYRLYGLGSIDVAIIEDQYRRLKGIFYV